MDLGPISIFKNICYIMEVLENLMIYFFYHDPSNNFHRNSEYLNND